ncbi:MAG TPA: radical SAM protein [Polyangiaceae bacterium]|jgi:radical SAM protein with 4Fe4S-binding SPASM domain|nr:radical SAM protein [Polyangiaceae bacterium]
MTSPPEIGQRPRTLPIAPQAEPSRRRLPLASEARDEDRRWRPIYAVWEITLRCDLACRHCGSRAGRSRPDELSTSEALDLVRQMAELGVREVTVIGGEAYLRDDWLEIVRDIRARGMQCTMTTGGRGVTAELARAAKDAGLQSVSVSVDGLRDTHDALRGVNGSYDSAMQALTELRGAGIPVSANTQVSRAALYEIEDVFGVLVEKGIHSWQVQLTVAMGRAADEPHLLLEPYQVLEVMPMLARIKKRADEARVRIWPGNNIGYFGPYESMLRGTLPRGHMSSCGAGRATLGIEANGDIKGCPSLPTADYVGGNIRENSLLDIWERAAPLRFTRDRTVEDLWGFCRDCYYNDVCRAGCSWTSHVLFGKPGNNPYCHHRSLELLQQGKRERLLRTVAAEGKPFDHGLFDLIVEDWPEHELERAKALIASEEGWLAD